METAFDRGKVVTGKPSVNPQAFLTGMGLVSAAGGSAAESLATFASERRNPGRVTRFATSLDYPVFEAACPLRESAPGLSRTAALALHALEEALADAGLPAAPGPRVGVCMGTTVASQLNDLDFYATLRRTGTAPLEPVERYLKGNLAEVVVRRIGATGPCVTVVNACSSSADAIGLARSWLRAGVCDIAFAGGADELNAIPLSGFGALGVASRSPCRPFDRDREGLNLGEGAAILILETETSARARGRTPSLFVAGYGAACDAHHLTAPRPDGSGLETAIRTALDQAGIAPSEIDFVNAHGTATQDNDRTEGSVLARVFGPEARVLSTKGHTGHTLGAAGALEAVFTALALREGWVPASAGFANRDDAIPIGALARRTAVTGRYALSTSLAFGGNNAALVIGRLA